MGETGCVAWMFENKGIFSVPKDGTEEDLLIGLALESGAEDVREEDDFFEIITAPENFNTVRETLEEKKVPVGTAAVTMIPKSTVMLQGKDAEQTLSLTEDLEDHDDVQSVAANFDVPPEMFEQTG